MRDTELQEDFVKLMLRCRSGEELKAFVRWINRSYPVFYNQLLVVNNLRDAGLSVGVVDLDSGECLC